MIYSKTNTLILKDSVDKFIPNVMICHITEPQSCAREPEKKVAGYYRTALNCAPYHNTAANVARYISVSGLAG